MVVGVVVLIAVLVLGVAAFAFLTYRQVGRVDVQLHGAPADATTYLLVGTDTREGLSPAEQRGLGSPDEVPGERADLIMVLQIPDHGRPRVASFPRDLEVIDDQGHLTRLGLVYERGPQHLVDTLCQRFGIGVNRLVVTRFSGFENLVNTIGGIDLDLAHPFRDAVSGSNLPQGRVHLDGAAALAYVRARHAELDTIYGWLPEPDSALRRGSRAREVLRAIAAELPKPTDPVRYARAAWAAAEAVSVDGGQHVNQLRELPGALQDIDGAREITIPVHLTDGPVPLASLGTGAPAALRRLAGPPGAGGCAAHGPN